MSFLKLNFKPGINRDQTNYSGEGGWWDCDKVRFWSGFPQKLGGWQKATSETFIGVSRQVWNWVTSYSDNFLGVSTDIKLYIEVGGQFYDITPLRDETAAGDVTFAASNGSSTITVSDTAHGVLAGDYVTFSGAVSLGGNITAAVLNQNYVVLSVPTANTFTISAKNPSTGAAVVANASDSGNGGASVIGSYEIHPGYPNTTAGYGWGAGAWDGNYPWGLAGDTPISLQQRDWFLDNFDNNLVANIRNGPIYYWIRDASASPTSSLATRAILLSDVAGSNSVPLTVNQTLVSPNDKHLLAFGCQPYAGAASDYDPLLIRWASQDEPEYWNPTGTTPGGSASSAGFLRVSRGSKIVRALPTRQETLVWTDTTLYSLQFTGTTDIFALQQLGDNISIISPRSVTSANNITYWMGTDKFYVYTGQIQTLPSTVREYVFKNINYAQVDQIVSGTNEGFNEIWWFYPSANSVWNDRYVVYNHFQQLWFFGSLGRTAWLDTPLRDYPTGLYTAEYTYEDTTAGTPNNGNLYQHEVGVDADGAAMNAYIQSNDFDIGEGDQFMLTRRIIPDISFNQSTAATPEVTFQIRPRNFPGGSYASDPSDTQSIFTTAANVNAYTNQVFMRARARQMALKVASDTLGVQWQLGSPRLDARQDGRR